MTCQIIRVPSPSLVDLERRINAQTAQGWRCEGGPFRDDESREWCQLLVKDESLPNGTVRLREPKK